MKTTEGLQRGNFIEFSEDSTDSLTWITSITGEYTFDKFGNNYKILVYETKAISK